MTERRSDLLLATEAALACLTAAAVLSMHLLFLDGSFRAPLLVQVLTAHVTVAVLRRRGVELVVSGLVTAVVGAVSITWTQYAQTVWALLPSGATWSAAQADINAAWEVFVDVSAPAPVEQGFIVIASLAIWAIVFVADWGAFRTGVSFEALLPSATLVLFGAVLGDERSAVASAALFTAAALAFFLLHRTWRQEIIASAAREHQRSRRALLSLGTALASFAVVGGAVMAPRLPGAEDPAIVPWRDISDADDTRVVVSPLVDVRSRLVDQPNVEVFTVLTDADGAQTGAHWRLAGLDTFDGAIWRSSYQTDEARGELPRSVGSTAQTRIVSQTITVQALAAIWLPAAFEPVAIDAGGADIDYDPRSSTLIVDRNTDTSDGMMYVVESALPQWTAEELRQAPDEIPERIAERYLQLPDDFSERIRDEAVRLTEDEPTSYDKAIAMMSYLRTFEYTQEPLGGHSVDALERFLFENQRGYCEQFAGAFAAMARSIGIPARVAVGFTKGIQDPNEPALFRVTGKHAHAWVEVYFEGLGWVTFDPTPGRAPPGAEAWLGVPEEQAADDGDGTVSTTIPGGATPQPAPAVPAPSPDSVPQEPPDAVIGEAPEEVTTRSDDSTELLPSRIRAVVTPIWLAVVGYLVIIPIAVLGQRHLRRRRVRDPGALIRLAWRETHEQTTAIGLELPPSLTFAERAARMRRVLPGAAAAIQALARISEHTLYAATTASSTDAAQLRAAADAISAEVARHRPWYSRALSYLDARRLVPPRQQMRRTAHGIERSRQTA